MAWTLGNKSAARGSRIILLFCCLVLAPSLLGQFQPTNRARNDFWDVNGTVHALLATNGTLYLGGSFSHLAPSREKVALIDAFTATADPQFPPVRGETIHQVIEDGQGGWYLAGNFNQVGTFSRSNLVHILADNRVDPDFNPAPNGPVHALALDGDILWIGGDFENIDGQTRQRLAALDRSSNTLLPWNPAANGIVHALVPSDDVVYVGGAFTEINGQTRRKIAAIRRANGSATSWNPVSFGDVLTLALAEHRLIAGGLFTSIGGELRAGLAALDTVTGLAAPWDPNPRGGRVNVVRVICDSVYVGGSFTNLSGVPRHRAGAVDIDTGQIEPWDPQIALYHPNGSPSSVSDILIATDIIYLAGNFSIVNGATRTGLAAVNAVHGSLSPWAPDTTGGVNALALSGRRLLAALTLSRGAVERNNVAAIDLLTGRVTDFNPGTDGDVLAFAYTQNRLFIGGEFQHAGAHAHDRIAAVDLLTGQVRADWNANANDAVHALATDGQRLFAGGRFTTINEQTRWRLASVDAMNGAISNDWLAQTDGTVDALVCRSNTLYAAGNFLTVSGMSRERVVALNASSAAVLGWHPNVNQRVRALALASDRLYLGGEFTAVNAQPRSYLAAVRLSDASALPWSPAADGLVRALALVDTTIYVGGSFQHLNGFARAGVGLLDNANTLLPWGIAGDPFNDIQALALTSAGLAVGGQMKIDGNTRALAVFPPSGVPVLSSFHDQVVVLGAPVDFTGEAEGLGPIHYQWSFKGTNLLNSTNALLHLDAAQLDQAGTYLLLATNAAGSSSAEVHLTVLQAPIIVSEPTNQIAAPGTTITLSVVATGSPAPIYQWRLNGANIPGAVFSTLTLNNAQPADGGRYQVVVANNAGASISAVATVQLTSPPLAFTDAFVSTATISSVNGLGSGDNSTATTEPGEPFHAGRVGGRSLWLSWTAPQSGIATFNSRGSGFDTLLAVYTGTQLNDLQSVTADDDRGGFLTSRVLFNATAGITYRIAIDGLGGANGPIVLRWSLETSAALAPRILNQPLSQSVTAASTVMFSVDATGSLPLFYQWFFGCRELRGETNATLIIANANQSHVGPYRVVIRNSSDESVESELAALELGPVSSIFSADKLEDALQRIGFFSGGGGQGGSASGALLVSFGSIVSQTLNTTPNTTSLGEPTYCGMAGGASAWLPFRANARGVVLVDTLGSAFDTLLAVYYPTNSAHLASAQIACDNDSALDGVRSSLRFQAEPATTYLAVVDGVNGARGQARINWRLGTEPSLQSLDPLVLTRRAGTELILVGPQLLDGTPPPAYHWELNGVALAGATNHTLTLSNLQPTQHGMFSLVASNFAGQVRRMVALVTVKKAFQLEHATVETGSLKATVTGEPGDWFTIESSPDLQQWQPILTEQLPAGTYELHQPIPPAAGFHFFRVKPAP